MDALLAPLPVVIPAASTDVKAPSAPAPLATQLAALVRQTFITVASADRKVPVLINSFLTPSFFFFFFVFLSCCEQTPPAVLPEAFALVAVSAAVLLPPTHHSPPLPVVQVQAQVQAPAPALEVLALDSGVLPPVLSALSVLSAP